MHTDPSRDPGPDTLADLAPSGRLRAALNFGNPVLVHRDPHSGQARGVTVELAQALGQRLGVPVDLLPFDAAARVFEAAPQGLWDVAFLAIDPVRAADIAFTAPYVVIEGSYLVPHDSPLRTLGDVDRAGIRIAVGRGAAYDLFLSRTLQHAQLVRAETSAAAVELFLAGGLDAAAGVRQPLLAVAQAQSGLRVIDGSFTQIQQAMGLPRRPAPAGAAGWRYLWQFVEDCKASGLVAAALLASGQRDAAVASARPYPG
jgi:polar amino acid transport system substrate-binding protein